MTATLEGGILRLAMPLDRDPEKNRQNTRSQRQKEKALLEAMTQLYGGAPFDEADKTAADIIRLGSDAPLAPLERKRPGRKPSGKVDSVSRKQVLRLYLEELPLAAIAARTGMFIETIQEILQIRNVACARCDLFKLGNTTMYEGEIPMCRACRRVLRL